MSAAPLLFSNQRSILWDTTFKALMVSLSRVCFEEFGGDVKFWITLNEPKETSLQGHGSGTMAPGLKGPGTLVYEAAHNQIRGGNTRGNQSTPRF